MGQVQNEEHLCLIAVIGVERPNKATVEREFEERQSGDSGAWSVCGRQPERIQRVNAETTERVDEPRTRRVRTCLSLSVYNKLPESSRANPVCFLPSYELCYRYYHIRAPQCDKGSPVFRKSIYSLVRDDKQLAADFYLIHYMGDETAYVPHKHGNAKTNRTFIPTKKQVFSDILLHDQGQAPSNIYKAVLAKASTNDQEQMPVNCPRNLKQVQNTVYAQRCKDRISHDEIFSLHELAYQLPGFIWHITTFTDLLVYAGMPDIVDLACANLEESVKCGNPQIISYDTTFEMGDYYVSILAMRNTALVNDPVFSVGFILHERKCMQNHEQFLTDILGKLGMDSTK